MARLRAYPAARRPFLRASALTLLAALALVTACDEDLGPAPLFPAGFEASWTEVRDCRFSIEHDGATIQVYANATAADPYLRGAWPLPDGSTLVKKEHLDGACGELDRFTVMHKDDGRWRWQRVNASRRVDTTLAVGGCVSCHTSCTDGRDLTCTDP